jgi:Zn-dependent peptidase ImmA (M78 family)
MDRLVKSGRIDPGNKDSSVTYSGLLNMDISLPLIILNFAAMEGKSEREKMAIIAHEIAHYVLGHHKPSCSVADKAEKEADDLIEKWGFPATYGIE